jgi:hypothetical protein
VDIEGEKRARAGANHDDERAEPGALCRGKMAVSEHTPSDEAEERRAIARIEQALSKLGSDYSPPLGWEARVLAASAQPPKRWWQRWQKWVLPAIPAALAAAAVLMFVIVKQPASPETRAGVQVTLSDTVIEDPCKNAAGNPACMNSDGSGCAIRQVRRLETTSAAAHLALRLYRGSSLVQSCDAPKACEVKMVQNQLSMIWTVKVLGSYTAVSIASDQPLPVLSGELDPDLAALERGKIANTANIAHEKKLFDCR